MDLVSFSSAIQSQEATPGGETFAVKFVRLDNLESP